MSSPDAYTSDAVSDDAFEGHHPEPLESDPIVHVMFYQDIREGRGRGIAINVMGGVDLSPCGAGTGQQSPICSERTVSRWVRVM